MLQPAGTRVTAMTLKAYSPRLHLLSLDLPFLRFAPRLTEAPPPRLTEIVHQRASALETVRRMPQTPMAPMQETSTPQAVVAAVDGFVQSPSLGVPADTELKDMAMVSIARRLWMPRCPWRRGSFLLLGNGFDPRPIPVASFAGGFLLFATLVLLFLCLAYALSALTEVLGDALLSLRLRFALA